MLKTEYLNNKDLEIAIAKFKQSRQDKIRYGLIIEDLRGASSRRGDGFLTDALTAKTKSLRSAEREHADSQGLLAGSFFKLAENILRYRKFHFVDTDDAVQEFVMICFEKIDRFDPVKGKAFNYMTTCILNHYRQLYRTARNYNELKRKYHDHLQVQQDSSTKTNRNTKKDNLARVVWS